MENSKMNLIIKISKSMDLREALRSRIPELIRIRGSHTMRKVALVPAEWHRRLIQWLNIDPDQNRPQHAQFIINDGFKQNDDSNCSISQHNIRDNSKPDISVVNPKENLKNDSTQNHEQNSEQNEHFIDQERKNKSGQSYQSENSVKPPQIDNSFLFSRMPQLKWHFDFEIVEIDVFSVLSQNFGCNMPLFALLTVHPMTGCSDVVFESETIEFSTPVGTFSKECSTAWYVDDLRRPLCTALKLPSLEHRLVPPNQKSPFGGNLKSIKRMEKQTSLMKSLKNSQTCQNGNNQSTLNNDSRSNNSNRSNTSKFSNGVNYNSYSKNNLNTNNVKTNEQNAMDILDRIQKKNMNEKLAITMTVGEYVQAYGNIIVLKSERSNSKLANIPNSKYTSSNFSSTPTMPPLSLTLGRVTMSTQKEESISVPERRIRPVGLNNTGNYCFFNSAIQVLIRINPFINFFRANKDKSKSCHLFNSAYETIRTKSSRASVDLTSLRRWVMKKLPEFADGNQHDCQEFLGALINLLEEDENKFISKASLQTSKNNKQNETKSENGTNEIHRLFFGDLKSKIECPSCGHKVAIDDHFLFLSLPVGTLTLKEEEYLIEDIMNYRKNILINKQSNSLKTHNFNDNEHGNKLKVENQSNYPPTANHSNFGVCNSKAEGNKNLVKMRRKTLSLRQSLKRYFMKDVLDNENLWGCSNCGKNVNAIHSMELTNMPLFLIIHLKRFCVSHHTTAKIDAKVEFPENLHFRNSSIGKDWKLRLKATIIHSGTIRNGHYTARCRDNTGWFAFNDEKVVEIDEKEAICGSPYILFYEATP
ncbi:hypothetical protein TRFO_22043 [Tritrichomonas foetus]|uniref:USP domain-containing protein n=1 Tax=Tritrichomonas foetus TaxID=1144522 RepID=A0A1J4KDC7_9EUKA|nr:hypothetical protein TRFO_22043 [Tritrichomonas foetus]|eukprot:OHT09203.1 hypothetical protein TRFO_22043 [Tritrichomonas foetus]